MKDTSKMQKAISKDGTVIGFWKSGSGPPLLLVHGTTADHSRWSPISPRFEQHFTVYAMDRRGRGGSGDAPDYDIKREAEDVAAVVEAIGEPVFVLGHSYGGVCSLEASLLTDKVSRLILYEPPIPTGLPQYPPGIPDRIQTLIDSGRLEAGLEVFFREVVRMPEHELEAYRQLPVWQVRIQLTPTIPREMMIDRTYRFNTEKFTGFQVPTMLLLGGDSPPLFQQAIELVDSTLSNNQVVILPGQQHIAMDTNPELFAREVTHFLLKDTLKMQVKVSGEGTPLVLVPGGLTGWASWEPFVEIFSAKQKKVIRVQLLNVQYGVENRDLPGGYSVKMESSALAATLNSLGNSKPLDIVGWSYGALTALDYALDHPERIRSLTLIEPPAIWALRAKGSIDGEIQRSIDFLETLHGNITEELLAAFLKEIGILKEGQQPQELPQWKEWVPFRQSLRNNHAILAQRDDLKRLQNFEPPVLLIKGTGSAKFHHQIIDILAANLPNARVIEMPGGHAPHIVSRDKFLSELEHFHKEQK